MHLSTIIIGDEVKSRPRFTNCQTFNIRLTRYRISAFSTPQSASRRRTVNEGRFRSLSSNPVSEEFGVPPVQDHSPGGPSKIAAGASASRSSPTEAEVFTTGLRRRRY
jgi:hypothetical protein